MLDVVLNAWVCMRIVWECALRGRQHLALDEVLAKLETFVRGAAPPLELQGG